MPRRHWCGVGSHGWNLRPPSEFHWTDMTGFFRGTNFMNGGCRLWVGSASSSRVQVASRESQFSASLGRVSSTFDTGRCG